VASRTAEKVVLLALEVLRRQQAAGEVPRATWRLVAQMLIAPDRMRRRTTACSSAVWSAENVLDVAQ
jgi:hypothetical protein